MKHPFSFIGLSSFALLSLIAISTHAQTASEPEQPLVLIATEAVSATDVLAGASQPILHMTLTTTQGAAMAHEFVFLNLVDPSVTNPHLFDATTSEDLGALERAEENTWLLASPLLIPAGSRRFDVRADTRALPEGFPPLSANVVVLARGVVLISDESILADTPASGEQTEGERLAQEQALAEERRRIYNATILREKQRFEKRNPEVLHATRGNILLQVEEAGEAWYVNPLTDHRRYLQDSESALATLRALGLGITNAELALIPIGVEERFQTRDSDGDGLADPLEISIGTDPEDADSDQDGYSDGLEIKNGFSPLGAGRLKTDLALTERLKGRVLLQVENRGEAWYVNPSDGKRYYMKDGEFAYQIMRFLGRGISNKDIAGIPTEE